MSQLSVDRELMHGLVADTWWRQRARIAECRDYMHVAGIGWMT